MSYPTPLDAEQQAVFEWQYGKMGHFRTALMKAIMKADDGNRARLALGFPNEVNGYIKYSEVSGWWQDVQDLAIEAGWIEHKD